MMYLISLAVMLFSMAFLSQKQHYTHWSINLSSGSNFQLISMIDGLVVSFETAVRWMSLDLNDDKSALL